MTNRIRYILLLFLCGIVLTLAIFSCKLKSLPLRDEEAEEERFDNPYAAAQWEFDMLKDEDGKIPAHIRELELAQARAIYMKQKGFRPLNTNFYTLQGPSNFGGRCRTVVYDVRYDGSSNQVILAGGVSGGVFKSTDGGATWVRKSSTAAVYSVTSIAQDPRAGHQDTWYYSTGEALGTNMNLQAPTGSEGVFKSTDNGETWSRLANSNLGVYEIVDVRQDLIWRLKVNSLNGDIYMAAIGAIFRSQDGGNTWQNILGLTSNANSGATESTDIVIAGSGRLYASFSGLESSSFDGVWTSTTGNSGTWTRIAGGASGDFPVGWPAQSEYDRVVLASAPSNSDIVYAFLCTGTGLCNGNATARLFKWDFSLGRWSNLSANLPACVAGLHPLATYGSYCMLLHVKPDNPNVVFIGGDNLFRSTDGFSTNTQVSEIGGYSNFQLHPDTHWIDFKPGDPNSFICATDGGLYRTQNDLATEVSWENINNGFTTMQYYGVAIDPVKGSDKITGGAQDNGTTRRIGSTQLFEQVNGSDGILVGLSKPINGVAYEYSTRQYGALDRFKAPPATDPGWTINPVPHSTYFNTLFKLDNDNTEYIYYCNDIQMFRNTSASTATYANWTELTGVGATAPSAITALATTRGNYNPAKSSLFIGCAGGKVYRLDDPANTAPSTAPVNISSPSFPNAYLSSISVNPRNDDTVILTFSNYNRISIWWTGNAHAASPTWINVERNLTLPSVRSSTIAVTANGLEYFVGTSVGLFHSTDVLSSDWTQESPDGIGNAVVSSLALRTSDNRLVVGTYGNAIWATTLSTPVLPVTLLKFEGKLNEDGAILNWSTSYEEKSRGFEIERSDNSVNFIKIGFVPASGNSISLQHYSYNDSKPFSSRNYYRLKIVDVNGNYSYSNVIMILGKTIQQDIRVINPFSQYIELSLSKMPVGKVKLNLYNYSGKLIAQEEFSGSFRRITSFNGAIHSLTSGAYLLEVYADNKKFVRKIVKQ